MKRHITIFAVLISVAATAQDRVMNLKECIAMALERNLQIKAADKAVERSKALQATAWDIGKTELSLSQDPTSGGSPDNSLSLSQSIEFPTVYIARRKQLKAETQAEESHREMERKRLANEVTEKYYQLVYQIEKQRILKQQDCVLARYRGIAEARYKAGETRKLELLTAERLQKENQMEASAAEREAESMRQALCLLLATDESVSPAERVLMPIDYVQGSFDYENTPEGRYAADRLTAADRAVSTAKSDYAPSLTLSIRNQFVISSWNPYDQDRSRFSGGNFMGFEAGIGIPLFYGATKAKVRAAKKDREIAELQMKQEQQERKKEYLTELSRCNSAFRRMTYYREEGTEKADELQKLATIEYESGEIGYVEYISALQESIGMRMKAAEAINEYNQCVISLRRLTPSR